MEAQVEHLENLPTAPAAPANHYTAEEEVVVVDISPDNVFWEVAVAPEVQVSLLGRGPEVMADKRLEAAVEEALEIRRLPIKSEEGAVHLAEAGEERGEMGLMVAPVTASSSSHGNGGMQL